MDFQRLTEFADDVLYVGLANGKFSKLAEVQEEVKKDDHR